MKTTLIRSLVSGVALCAMAVALCGQSVPQSREAVATAPLTPAPIVTICGACGEQIHPAAPVYVAQPVYPRQGEGRGARGEGQAYYPPVAPGQSFYGIPPVGYVAPQYGAPCGYSPYGYPPGWRVPVAPRSVLLSHGPAVVAGSAYYKQLSGQVARGQAILEKPNSVHRAALACGGMLRAIEATGFEELKIELRDKTGEWFIIQIVPGSSPRWQPSTPIGPVLAPALREYKAQLEEEFAAL